MRYPTTLQFASIVLLLASLAPAVRAQDTDPPLLAAVQVDVDPYRNGDPIMVTVAAAANEPSRFEVTCTYASSYPLYGELAFGFFAHKTAAVGDHTGASLQPATSVADLEVLVGPRCFHSDTLTVSVVAVDTVGNRSEPAVAFQAAIDMPFPTPAPMPDGDTYAVSTHWNGSTKPSDHNLATLAEWAQPDVILCTSAFIFEGPQTDPGWDHWVERVRGVPESNNSAVVGFASLSAMDNDDYPVWQRMYEFLWSVHDEVDENVLVHLTDGTLPAMVDGDEGKILLNVFNETARDTFAWFLAQEWNHCENRAPRVGLLFDVYEYWTDYPIGDDYAGWLIDRDRDGIALLNDPDELEGTRLGRIDMLRTLRRHIAATSSDPNVGRYFLTGANTVSGRSDAELLAELDFVMLEDFQCPPGASTEFDYYDGEGCRGEHVVTYPFHGAASEHFTRYFCPTIYYYNHLFSAGILPNPSDLSQAWEDLPSRMRSEAGGPFLAPESRGGLSHSIHPGYLEVFCLLFDDFYPIYHLHGDLSWNRQLWHPEREGLPDLHGLGAATSPLIRDGLDENVLYLRRQYAAGSVEVVMADTNWFDCEANDLFDYRVTVNGQVRRQSDSWGAPGLETFFVADWDSGGIGGTIRIGVTALASEPVLWERSYRLGNTGDWSLPVTGVDRSTSLGGSFDTGLQPQAGSLWVRVRGRDQTGLNTDWAKREVILTRFGGFGVVIADTVLHGTSYGLPDAQGGYEIVGRGTSAPDFAPPHFLEITGSAPDGFLPVEVRWHNSLGGQGVAEGTVSWRIPGVPLQRGTNVITISCINAAGTARVGTVTKVWDFPGKPGRR